MQQEGCGQEREEAGQGSGGVQVPSLSIVDGPRLFSVDAEGNHLLSLLKKIKCLVFELVTGWEQKQ